MRKIISQHLFRRSFTLSIMAYRFFFIFKESDLSQLWEEGTWKSRNGNWGSGMSPASQSEKPSMLGNWSDDMRGAHEEIFGKLWTPGTSHLPGSLMNSIKSREELPDREWGKARTGRNPPDISASVRHHSWPQWLSEIKWPLPQFYSVHLLQIPLLTWVTQNHKGKEVLGNVITT